MLVETIVLECDLCKTEGDGVETHALTVDGKAVEVEACGRDWAKAEKALIPFVEAGRKPPRASAVVRQIRKQRGV